jgi:multimeric flavodoxin WrbA
LFKKLRRNFMSVLLINGSPRSKGCTFTALSIVANQLEKNGLQTQLVQLGAQPVRDCISCYKCAKTGQCVFKDDQVNELVDTLAEAEALVVGSPVYYAGPNASICALLNRLFFMKSSKYAFKPAAAVVSCRRGGASASFDRLNKYFTIARMPVVSSQYWNSVHGNTPDEVMQDKEGLQVMRALGDNMAWLVRCIAAGKAAGIDTPTPEPWEATNFIR